jgi:hypothetical protein
MAFRAPGDGNSGFFELAVELRGAGMSMAEIDATLGQELQFARSPDERLRQIPNIMDTLTASRRAA